MVFFFSGKSIDRNFEYNMLTYIWQQYSVLGVNLYVIYHLLYLHILAVCLVDTKKRSWVDIHPAYGRIMHTICHRTHYLPRGLYTYTRILAFHLQSSIPSQIVPFPSSPNVPLSLYLCIVTSFVPHPLSTTFTLYAQMHFLYYNIHFYHDNSVLYTSYVHGLHVHTNHT